MAPLNTFDCFTVCIFRSKNATELDTNATAATKPEIRTHLPAAVLPPKGDAEKEHKNSLAIFFILIIIGRKNFCHLKPENFHV